MVDSRSKNLKLEFNLSKYRLPTDFVQVKKTLSKTEILFSEKSFFSRIALTRPIASMENDVRSYHLSHTEFS